ncbi:MAG: sugar phosphate isomerase/epimerase [Elusimicrobia bacterium]|nr:sugar phosphate isomerase/epimerase [Elusimicrobiota bacterium]
MKIGISGRVIEVEYKYCEIGVTDFFKLAKKLGYEAVELRPTQVNYKTPDAELAEYRKVKDDLGLDISCITAFGADEKDKKFSALARYVEINKLFNCNFVKTWSENIEWLRDASEYLGRFGMNMIIQTHTRGPFETVNGILVTLGKIHKDNFGLYYDASHLFLTQDDYGIETIKKLNKKIFQVSIQSLARVNKEDSEMEYKGYYYKRMPLGKDRGIDYKSVFKGLKEIGFDGYITINDARPKEKSYKEYAEYMIKQLRTFINDN